MKFSATLEDKILVLYAATGKLVSDITTNKQTKQEEQMIKQFMFTIFTGLHGSSP